MRVHRNTKLLYTYLSSEYLHQVKKADGKKLNKFMTLFLSLPSAYIINREKEQASTQVPLHNDTNHFIDTLHSSPDDRHYILQKPLLLP